MRIGYQDASVRGETKRETTIDGNIMRPNPLDYQALIFDCDGTLTDSMELHYAAWQATMAVQGIDFGRERFYALGGMPTEKIIRLLAEEAGLQLAIDLVAGDKEDAFDRMVDRLQPFVPVFEIARAMRGRLPMAVASGGRRSSIRGQLRQLGCEDWFDAIVTAEDTQRHKPEPDVFLHAAALMGVPPQRCLVYEDADLGVAAAAAAGMDCVDVREWRRLPEAER